MHTLTKTTTINVNNNNHTTNIFKLNYCYNITLLTVFTLLLHVFNLNFTLCYVLIIYLCKAPPKQ